MKELERKHDVSDELLAKLDSYRKYREGTLMHLHLRPEEQQFLAQLLDTEKKDTKGQELQLLPEDPLQPLLLHQYGRMANGDDLDDAVLPGGAAEDALRGEPPQRERVAQPPPPPPAGEARGEDGYVEESRAPSQLNEIHTMLIKLQAFLQAYPHLRSFRTSEGTTNEEVLRDWKGKAQSLEREFKEDPDPERNTNLRDRIRNLHNTLKEIVKQMDIYDARMLDLRAEQARMGWKQIWGSIEWVNIFTIMRIFKDIQEDIKRRYNRWEEGTVGRVGENITAWIPQWVPGFGMLSAEFHRREKEAELTEIEQWKKAIKDFDSFELQETLHHPVNKDHMRAIIEQLTERGRMDWNDEEFWKVLNEYSFYHMPIEKCRRNENLREEWLRKMVDDIFRDKELYRNWKQANDSHISSGKEKYRPEADRLSNLEGGLAGELEKQLRIYTEIRERQKRGERITMDDAVQPHLYEGVIHYAIRNGKMSMEQKFYYLVRGVASGLLSADRLRVLAGEEGGILLLFPFIDYFYQRNNTLPELKALEARLIEKNVEGKDTFQPGIKTTLWLELEVAREEKVRERLQKGAYRKGGEMDHDDMHFFLPRLDFKTIDIMATPQGGGRQQLTSEGWRNGYTGYNSFFRSFGMLARLARDRLARFTTQDAQQVARAIAGFVRLDGIMTKRSAFGGAKDRRPSIPWAEMRTTYSVVSDRSKTVYEERDIVDRFVKRFLEEYGYGAENIQALLYSTEDIPNPTVEQENQAYALSDALETWLTRALTNQGTEKMKRVLMEFVDQFTSHAGPYQYETVRRGWQEREVARRRVVAHAA
jgi:hypothetical protein